MFPGRDFLPEPFKKQYGQHKVLFLGRLCKEKGVKELIQIVPSLKERFDDIKVYLGGVWEDKELKGKFWGEIYNILFTDGLFYSS